jgi:hypothetical protein
MTRELENRVIRAEKEVHECLNYGGVFHDKRPTRSELELAYEQGDLSVEVAHMRRFAAALTELANALQAEETAE